MAPRLRASHGAAAQLVALPASSQSHSPAALAVPELEVRNLSDPHPPTPQGPPHANTVLFRKADAPRKSPNHTER